MQNTRQYVQAWWVYVSEQRRLDVATRRLTSFALMQPGALVLSDRRVGAHSACDDAGDWTCPDCTSNNFARRQECFRCGAPRRALPHLLLASWCGVYVAWCDNAHMLRYVSLDVACQHNTAHVIHVQRRAC
jgi:hypothetical protein